jgi:hypothetical protein
MLAPSTPRMLVLTSRLRRRAAATAVSREPEWCARINCQLGSLAASGLAPGAPARPTTGAAASAASPRSMTIDTRRLSVRAAAGPRPPTAAFPGRNVEANAVKRRTSEATRLKSWVRTLKRVAVASARAGAGSNVSFER